MSATGSILAGEFNHICGAKFRFHLDEYVSQAWPCSMGQDLQHSGIQHVVGEVGTDLGMKRRRGLIEEHSISLLPIAKFFQTPKVRPWKVLSNGDLNSAGYRTKHGQKIHAALARRREPARVRFQEPYVSVFVFMQRGLIGV